MRRKPVRLVVIFALALLTAPLAANAQAPTKVYRIGLVRPSTVVAMAPETEAFKQHLWELGYTEGQNLVIEARFGTGTLEGQPELVAELVRLQVDCLVVGGIGTTRIAKQATSTIPIVMINASDDPVRLGLITSLARPGGNITGVIDIVEQLAGKRLELLKEAFPHLARVGHLSDKNAGPETADLQEVEAAARLLGVHVQPLEMHGPDELEQAFRIVREARAEALIVTSYGFLFSHRERIVQLVDAIRMPVMYQRAEFVQIGGLMSYSDDPLDRSRRAVKRVTRPILGCKSFDAAQGTLAGIEVMHVIKKKQMVVEAGGEGLTAVAQFYSLAA